jgi:isoquinoline 1-oxidoreductase subunit beta
MLIAAAAHWDVTTTECSAANGLITHVPSGRTLTFGPMAHAAASVVLPAAVHRKKPDQWKLIGTRQKRLDVPDKVTGKAIFGTDVRLPNMLYAAIRQCPVFQGTPKSVDARAASSRPGVRGIVQLPHAVAVVADSWWQANQAVEAIGVIWDDEENARLSSADIQVSLRGSGRSRRRNWSRGR